MRNYRFNLIVSLALVASAALATPALAAPSRILLGCNPAAAAKVIVATNAYRASLGLSQLRLLRNASYARHGREFRAGDLRQAFSRQGWYRVDGDAGSCVSCICLALCFC